jgi:hypothetical protein
MPSSLLPDLLILENVCQLGIVEEGLRKHLACRPDLLSAEQHQITLLVSHMLFSGERMQAAVSDSSLTSFPTREKSKKLFEKDS